MMEANRKHWNEQQQLFQKALLRNLDHDRAVALFLDQHAMVHSAKMRAVEAPGSELWSFEDEVWEGLNEANARRVPPKGEHSIVWMVWHVTRCEDITLNMLAAGTPQVLTSGGWLERMNVPFCDTGNAMNAAQIASLSAGMDLEALHGYRWAVGRRTREIVKSLAPGALRKNVEPARLERVLAEGAVLEAAGWLIEYWGGRTIGGLLSMPATRHPFVHWNEALKVRKKLQQD